MKINQICMAEEGAGGGGGGANGSGAAGGNGGAAGTIDWKASLPEDIRSHASLSSIKDIPSLAKSYVHAQQLVGADKILKPQKNWTQEQWGKFYSELGRPENPDGYSFKPEGLPEGVEIDEAKFGEAKKFLHQAGLTDTQAASVLKYYLDTVGGNITNIQKQRETDRINGLAQLREKWGNDLDTKINLAQAVVKRFGGEEFQEAIDQIGNNPKFVALFASIGEAMMDDSAKGAGAGLIVTDSASALSEINQLKGDLDFQKALMDRAHPGHNMAKERWVALHEKAYPTKK